MLIIFMNLMKKIEIHFKNKNVVITGSSRGIGKNIASKFKALGANVTNLNSSMYDLTVEEEILKLCKYLSKLRKIDILINNAGINFSELNKKINLEKYNKLMNINLKAVFLITSTVSKIMQKNKFGRIVNISSIASHRVREGRTVYSASKFGLEGFTKTLSLELAKYNILVNSIAPGFINTEMTRTMLTKNEIKKLSYQVPLKRLGKTEDITNATIFLCSNLNQFINGHTLVVDGGFLSAVNV